MQIVFNGTGSPELQRDDGWFYRLHGIVSMDMRWDDHGYSFGSPTAYVPRRTVLEVSIRDLSDKTLDSIRVLRDEFTESEIHVIHDI